MAETHPKELARAREHLLQGRAAAALDQVEAFLTRVERDRIAAPDRPAIERQLADLRVMAQAAMAGTESAMRQIEEIVQAARSLRTYDSDGRRHIAQTGAELPRRF